jgi:fused signal recognition particle receptor
MAFFRKLRERLTRSSSKLDEGIADLVASDPVADPRRALDDDMLEQLEELLITADMGVETAMRVTANMAEGRYGRMMSAADIKDLLATEIAR